jgi:phage-related protein
MGGSCRRRRTEATCFDRTLPHREMSAALAWTYNLLYTPFMSRPPKPVEFRDASLDDLRAFPPDARRMARFQLDRVQHDEEPHDWKTMKSIGGGVREIRVRSGDGAYRVIYTAKFTDAIYVLHCFQKKSQRTSREDIALAARRYKQLLEDLK